MRILGEPRILESFGRFDNKYSYGWVLRRINNNNLKGLLAGCNFTLGYIS